ncbi:MAG TPA: indole-3-glycerol phosphate synthase TrpC [Candidatus Egerieimonas intestinavium]|uniref:Indole-3-glycerol phosphate synthase n=1 Tax=Candidatus Egerieimonas intestinavium TaxID=2840777 RepID=A0A9D1ELS2_9FIRM|nr:indole-3-glycerol phosphate synthase TrpC [Candidatus Egerieimonas intestinavium]
MNILTTIAEKTKERIAGEKNLLSLAALRAQAESNSRKLPAFAFEQALRKPGLQFICEVKKASPSKGIIAEDFPYLSIAREYQEAGAAAISCLTEPYWFLGSDQYLREIAAEVSIPVLKKDFTIDEYMIYQARAYGASAVLLICSILDDDQLKSFGQLAQELGLSALVEAHTEEEIHRALSCGARIIGVNNRNLKDFQVDVSNSLKLRQMIPPEVVFVSESGVQTPEDTRKLYENGTDAVLIGETLMRSPNKKKTLYQLKKAGGNL